MPLPLQNLECRLRLNNSIFPNHKMWSVLILATRQNQQLVSAMNTAHCYHTAHTQVLSTASTPDDTAQPEKLPDCCTMLPQFAHARASMFPASAGSVQTVQIKNTLVLCLV